MPIAAGILSQRVTVRTPNPLANPVKNKLGKLVATGDEKLYRDTPRWARVITASIAEKTTPGAVVADGSFVIVMRRDSFTRGVAVGDKIQWDGLWFAVTDRDPNVFDDTMEFSSVPSDDTPREFFDPTNPELAAENEDVLITENGEILVLEYG